MNFWRRLFNRSTEREHPDSAMPSTPTSTPSTDCVGNGPVVRVTDRHGIDGSGIPDLSDIEGIAFPGMERPVCPDAPCEEICIADDEDEFAVISIHWKATSDQLKSISEALDRWCEATPIAKRVIGADKLAHGLIPTVPCHYFLIPVIMSNDPQRDRRINVLRVALAIVANTKDATARKEAARSLERFLEGHPVYSIESPEAYSDWRR